MASIKINRQRCKGCQLCLNNCPQGLLVLDESLNNSGVSVARFMGGECRGCTFCAQVCPECCIEVHK